MQKENQIPLILEDDTSDNTSVNPHNTPAQSVTPDNKFVLSDEQENFINFVIDERSNVLLLGKAGVGKSTATRLLCEEANARGLSYAITAPTGKAAINVGGETVHRFISQLKRGSINVGAIQFILIDEVSMVRADLLDELSDTLKSKTMSNEPFGGVQMVLVGDPGQLPPVVNSREKAEVRYLAEHYHSEHFFSAASFAKAKWNIIELTQIFRQKDDKFPKLLNMVREGNKAKPLAYLNKFRLTREPKGVILTGRNADADTINSRELLKLDTPSVRFEAAIAGDIEPRDYPTDKLLELKVGARVMVIKNIYESTGDEFEDSSLELINGDTGNIVELDSGRVVMLCDRTGDEHSICSETWVKKASIYDEKTRKLSYQEVGSFSQIPLRLAWAVTIHKAQGATLQEVTIDFRKPMFAAGQAYVALSRGVALEDVWIMGRIRPTDIKTDKSVANFLKQELDSTYVGIKPGSQFDIPEVGEISPADAEAALDKMLED